MKLANRAYTYLLTTTLIEPVIETNLFAYNTTTVALRYTSIVFIGIIIDTSTLRKSIASYRQL